MNSPFDLTGRVALVTGGSSGIGQAICAALARAGADIGVVSRGEPAATRALVEGAGRRFTALTADLAELTDGDALIAACVAAHGRIDILVNAAGTIHREAALTSGTQAWDAVLGTNLRAAFLLSGAAARRFISQGGPGRIINIASMLSFQGGLGVASYAASKSGLAGLTRALANEWAGHGIGVNAIAPGYIATPMTSTLLADQERNRAILARIPAGRWGSPEDIGGMAVFLASDAAAYCHGAIYAVDGGWLSR
jgi:2-deoxy-D-gluconate 3-dehydrogenase